MTVFHNKKNGIVIPRLPPPLRKTGKVLKQSPGRHTNNNLLLRRPTRYPLPFQIRSINSGLIFGSPSSPSSPPSPSSPSSPSFAASSSPLSSTETITQLLDHLHLHSGKPGFEITHGIAHPSLYDLPSSYSPPANKSGNNNLDVPSSLPPPANKHSSSNNTTPTPFLEFLNRHQQGTEPIQIPEEYLFHPHADTRYEVQFFDQCYPDSSMYGIHMILTKFDTMANKYNIDGYNKLPSTSDSKIYKDVIKNKDTPPKGCDPVLYYNFLMVPPHAGSRHPQHTLKLKVGLPIMLLEEVGGVCAGTRLIVKKLEEDVITASEVVAVGGQRGGREIQIQRQEYKESTRVEPLITYTRRQFPVKHAFALTVNDLPEGVMFEGLGLDLKYDMASPGQLHSVLSRCRDPSKLKVYNPKAAAVYP